MKGLYKIALVTLVVAACGGDVGITEPVNPTATPVSGGLLALGVDSTTGASIETNKDDYVPGEVVHLVGRGWAPGETVNLSMTEDPNTHADVDTNVVADGAGAFVLHFYDVQDHDLGVTFTLTATGQISNSRAVAVFTDARSINSVTMNGSTPPPGISVSAGAAVAAVVNGSTTCTGPAAGCVISSGSTSSTTDDWKSTRVSLTGPKIGGGPFPTTTQCIASINLTAPTPAGGTNHSFNFTAPTDAGTYDVQFRMFSDAACTSGESGASNGNFANGLTVTAPANVAPVLSGVPTTTQNIPEMVLYTFDANATDNDMPAQTLTLSIVGSLPTGATFNTTTGVFEWTPTEVQGPSGPHTFIVRVSDGVVNTDQEVTLNVLEVNRAPELTVPASFNTQWGVSLTDGAATASDPDLPANTLTFSKVGTTPSWVTVDADGTIHYGAIGSSAVGPHTVTIKVEDNGSPVMSDQESFTITVTNRPTTVEYTGRNAGQYSDESTLSAILKDDGDGALKGTAIAGALVDLWFNGNVVCDDRVTDASGLATCDYAIAVGAGTVKVKATFAAAGGYAASTSVEEDFDVSKENAQLVSVSINGGNGSIPVSQNSFAVTLGVKESMPAGSEPNQNDGQLAGNINLATVTARITGLATNTSYNAACVAGAAVATDSYVTRSWTCTFTGGPFEVDGYTLALDIPTANSHWVATTYEEALAIWDPAAGFATGGGSFMLDGDRVSFGFSYTLTKGKSTPRSGFVVIRHMTGGGVCRLKSNNQMNAPAVNGNTVTLSGKGNYSCTDANGLAIVGQSQGNVTIAAYAEDNATSGADADKFWVTNGASVTPNNLRMDGTGGAAVNAIMLRGGNVQVPQPGSNK